MVCLNNKYFIISFFIFFISCSTTKLYLPSKNSKPSIFISDIQIKKGYVIANNKVTNYFSNKYSNFTFYNWNNNLIDKDGDNDFKSRKWGYAFLYDIDNDGIIELITTAKFTNPKKESEKYISLLLIFKKNKNKYNIMYEAVLYRKYFSIKISKNRINCMFSPPFSGDSGHFYWDKKNKTFKFTWTPS